MTVANENPPVQEDAGYRSRFLCLPVADLKSQESTCIASWAILIRDYFAQDCPSFICVKPDSQHTASWNSVSEDLKGCQIALSLDARDTTIDLTKRIRNIFLECSQKYTEKHESDTAVFIFETDASENEILNDDATRIMDLIKVRIEQNETTHIVDKKQGRYLRGHANCTRGSISERLDSSFEATAIQRLRRV